MTRSRQGGDSHEALQSAIAGTRAFPARHRNFSPTSPGFRRALMTRL